MKRDLVSNDLLMTGLRALNQHLMYKDFLIEVPDELVRYYLTEPSDEQAHPACVSQAMYVINWVHVYP